MKPGQMAPVRLQNELQNDFGEAARVVLGPTTRKPRIYKITAIGLYLET